MVMSGKLRVPPEMATSSYARVSSLCGSTVLVPDLVPASRAADDFFQPIPNVLVILNQTLVAVRLHRPVNLPEETPLDS